MGGEQTVSKPAKKSPMKRRMPPPRKNTRNITSTSSDRDRDPQKHGKNRGGQQRRHNRPDRHRDKPRPSSFTQADSTQKSIPSSPAQADSTQKSIPSSFTQADTITSTPTPQKPSPSSFTQADHPHGCGSVASAPTSTPHSNYKGLSSEKPLQQVTTTKKE